MTIVRGLYLLSFLGVLSVGVVALRTDQIRTAANIERMRGDVLQLRRESWTLQMEIARLRTPEQVRNRVERWTLNIEQPVPPSEQVGEVQWASVDWE